MAAYAQGGQYHDSPIRNTTSLAGTSYRTLMEAFKQVAVMGLDSVPYHGYTPGVDRSTGSNVTQEKYTTSKGWCPGHIGDPGARYARRTLGPIMCLRTARPIASHLAARPKTDRCPRPDNWGRFPCCRTSG